MPASDQELHATPMQRVVELEQKLFRRASGGCIYVLSDELSMLVDMAKEGATSIERRSNLLNVLGKINKS